MITNDNDGNDNIEKKEKRTKRGHMPPKDSVLGKHLKSCKEKMKDGIKKEALISGRFKSEKGQKWTLPDFDPISVPNHGKPNKFCESETWVHFFDPFYRKTNK